MAEKQAAVLPIATLTLNPALDVTYDVPGLITDQKVHAHSTRFDPGGSGVNVSRALRRLHVPARCYAILAGEIGQLFFRLISKHVDAPYCVWVDGETRINGTILQNQPHQQFEIDGIGPSVPQEALSEITEAFVMGCQGGFAVLTGSLPQGVPTDFYDSLIDRLQEQGTRAVVDAGSDYLRRIIPHRPFLIKPNRFELEQVLGRKLTDLDTVADAAWEMHGQGIKYVCVSLGKEGAILAGPDGVLHGTTPPVKVVSTVGAGDSMVGGLVGALARGQDAEDALRLGLACGAGTVQMPGTQLFDPRQLESLRAGVSIRRLRYDLAQNKFPNCHKPRPLGSSWES